MPFAFGIGNGYSLGIKNRLLIQEILVLFKKKRGCFGTDSWSNFSFN
jgi:hypothetical protein